MQSTFGFIFAAIIVTLIEIIGFATLISGVTSQNDTSSWPSVYGTVDAVSAREYWTRPRRRSTAVYRYEIQIRYRYEVNGKLYFSNRLDYSNTSFDKPTRDLFMRNHYVGSDIKVYYNPVKPGEAVILSGSDPATGIVIFMLFIFGALTLWLWYMVPVSYKKERQLERERREAMQKRTELVKAQALRALR